MTRVQYMDKSTLGSSSILGLKTDTHLTVNQCVAIALSLFPSCLDSQRRTSRYNWYDFFLCERTRIAHWLTYNVRLGTIFYIGAPHR